MNVHVHKANNYYIILIKTPYKSKRLKRKALLRQLQQEV